LSSRPYTLALLIGMSVDGLLAKKPRQFSAWIEVKFYGRQVFVGDTMYGESECSAKREASRPRQGIGPS